MSSLLTEASLAEVSLLEAQEQNLKPEPGQYEHEHHVGESEAEPAGKVNHTTIFRKEPLQKMRKMER